MKQLKNEQIRSIRNLHILFRYMHTQTTDLVMIRENHAIIHLLILAIVIEANFT